MHKHLSRFAKKFIIGIIGTIVLIIGIIMVPYPGPGWLIVFAGLSILASEFSFANNLLNMLKSRYESWQRWLNRQNIFIKAAIFFILSIILITTIWIINGYGVIVEIFGLDFEWLKSPLFK